MCANQEVSSATDGGAGESAAGEEIAREVAERILLLDGTAWQLGELDAHRPPCCPCLSLECACGQRHCVTFGAIAALAECVCRTTSDADRLAAVNQIESGDESIECQWPTVSAALCAAERIRQRAAKKADAANSTDRGGNQLAALFEVERLHYKPWRREELSSLIANPPAATLGLEQPRMSCRCRTLRCRCDDKDDVTLGMILGLASYVCERGSIARC